MAMEYTPRYFRKMACLSKLEAGYAEDATPLPVNRVIMSNVNFRPMVAQRIERNLILPYLSNQGVILVGIYATIEGDIELSGSGVPGTPPLWGTALRSAGMSETVVADTEVVYERAATDESCSIYFVMDGVRHILVGCRADLTFNLQAPGLPSARVTYTGLLGTITDVANPVISTAGWLTPLPVGKENTKLTLHGWNAVGQSLSIGLGNRVTPRFLIGHEGVHITDKKPTGTAVVEAVSLATIDWFDRAKKRTRAALAAQHGRDDPGGTPGNIIEFEATAVEVGEPTPGESDGFLNYSLALDIIGDGGLDLKITVR
ncbi:hypothetical protein [Shinella sp.]|uniref:hypothetical protein n=1 Tax=Shinella sp. TaxID=1870904 RepID=UPI002583A806|nr:hypothetical protein [Shinella sp.]